MLDDEILDVVDVGRFGVAEARDLRGALAVLARRALRRVVCREVLDVDVELIGKPLDAGGGRLLDRGGHEAQPADRSDGNRGRQAARGRWQAT
ncbi:MAG: hypothetical protein M3417_03260 [Actinomycetota bacterium]|nr:hypothetical protein [Actinomycetota bacterium]